MIYKKIEMTEPISGAVFKYILMPSENGGKMFLEDESNSDYQAYLKHLEENA